ncbi:hypothetical protein ACWT_5860 [Actinoplanes sp. SE50]|uniref:hypothetical protein n=1 Tax=unclassified Actinoplanes TaxID=2626549 RepID=UPI00023EBDD0|nr:MULTISPECIES: hypothetical protein [unclassified Actinoplanes]AEV86878.1 hypothetical protein ACPL_5991 [Actinoplanes sp. SE50/110]ATO85275.1 hypothetical protein ACWT_5860 [Actinoplanes sp. SE50]SLM02685.1 hypothetical protein ACSP50_5967 [Actinoplanes sp. SE50/110]
MIRIRLVDGRTVETNTYTLDQAYKLMADGHPLQIGGPEDCELQPVFADDPQGENPRQAINAAAIVSIEEDGA